MKFAFAVLAGGIGALVGALWLIGFAAHQVGLFTSSVWQGFGGTMGTGVECMLFGALIVLVTGIILAIIFFAIMIIDEEIIGPIRFSMQQEKERKVRLQGESV